ncbi:hypothetical protein [Paraferrimonas sp. SM1919]|uniref:hypothetical protein n=1 Tax=Paraferrimonas sp. SM1919 TaxID=2662263 RepID=UPI0013D26F8A|nr:hypothetical protein [Paraferrimonas sp. SM1919]
MKLFLIAIMLVLPLSVCAKELDVEELRVNKAQNQLPEVVNRYQSILQHMLFKLKTAEDERHLNSISYQQGLKLWQQARVDVQSGNLDDRSLYWGRLWLAKHFKQAKTNQVNWLTQVALKGFEQSSRGITDISFSDQSDIRILVTGFDPFLLDKDISQSNPSGIAALALDNISWRNKSNQQVEIQSLIVPVRFKDFDQGLIEAIISPLIKHNKVDMIVTISMGREHFDLERFPGLNRSSAVVDNLNVLTGANVTKPLPPRLKKQPLQGPQFLEFSLPVAKMQQATGRYKINDRRLVTTLTGQIDAANLNILANEISVQGSGGGYLSNEISYRTLLQLQNLQSEIVAGHIHTPKIKGHDRQAALDILKQIQKMLVLASH